MKSAFSNVDLTRMPLYEYQCLACGERSEILQRLSDPPSAHCPKCGGDVKKLISSSAIQFKGSGFYKTDYASTSTAKSSEKSESKSESKSDAKTEKKTSE
jgi:putative FmdB family regulatory protein